MRNMELLRLAVWPFEFLQAKELERQLSLRWQAENEVLGALAVRCCCRRFKETNGQIAEFRSKVLCRDAGAALPMRQAMWVWAV